MKKIREIMASPVYTANENDTLKDIAIKMLDKNIGCLPVLNDEDEIVGFISETDFTAKKNAIPFSRNHAPKLFGKWLNEGGLELMYESAKSIKAKEVMSTPPITVEQDEEISKLIEIIMKYNIHRIPVVDEGKLVGMVSRRDLLKLILSQKE